jgi:two-component system chemotaxis sensor kinase CheA
VLRTLINAIGSPRGADECTIAIEALVEAFDYLHEHGVCNGGEPRVVEPQASLEEPGETSAPQATSPTTAAEPNVSAAPENAANSADTNIRVAVGVLDKLMNLAGELVLSRNQLLQGIAATGQASLETTAARIDQVTSELQEAIMQTRMQPLAHIFSRFPRVIRDLSAKLGKQCELVINGKDVEVDKSIIESIGDPLVHLVRNSLDHGIELPDVRTKRGKRSVGTITLDASHQAGRVNIVVRDDGAGIDPAKLRQKAVAKGILNPDQAAALSDREALDLIFHPGFSTAEAVTEVSGRGVGMDVVKTNITRLGGSVEVNSHLGRGTELHIKLPLTLAIIPSLIVRCGEQRFAVSQACINELVRVKGSEFSTRISKVKGAEVLRLRGKLLPLVRLTKALGLGPTQETTTALRGLDIIVVETGGTRYGLVVDGLHDSEEIVVKPLGRHLKNCSCLAGATILGDGQVALILDVTGIANRVDLARSSDNCENESMEARDQLATEVQTTLLFTNDPHETFGVPMAVIRRLERVRHDQIEAVGGRLLLEYENRSLPLINLEDHVRAKPRPDQEWLYIVIFEFNGHEVGLIVPTLDEICNLPIDVDAHTLREPGILGSVVVDRLAIRLVDVYELATRAYPQLSAPQRPTGVQRENRTYRILLAEDSAFFRSQVAAFLASQGYEVVECEDGQEAWDTLILSDQAIDLILTDIEMPRMNGFELCTQIRASEGFAEMPIIALTSLAGEKDMERGRTVGVDDYQVKMDRDQLLAAVKRLLTERAQAARPSYV